MRIDLSSVMVDDQEKALQFYTGKLGFVKMADIPMGDYRFLTVTSPEGPQGIELVIEPIIFPQARDFQKALFESGVPIIAFRTDDIDLEYKNLKAKGVIFKGEPQIIGPMKSVLFEDTCGNLINLVQPLVKPNPQP
jgi:catechol 2,3-dioxygenase-like lactoylglutathione lyase family enzyme